VSDKRAGGKMELKEILLVDEKSPALGSISNILRGQGYQVMLAPDAITAFEEVQNYHFDLILVSLGGKEVDKLNLIRRVKISSPHARLIVVGDPQMTLPVEVFQCKVDDYFLPPITCMELSMRVDRCLKGDKVALGDPEEKVDVINGHILNSLRLKIQNIHNGLLSLQAYFNTLIYHDFKYADVYLGKIDEMSKNLFNLTNITEDILYNMLISGDETEIYLVQKKRNLSSVN